MSQAAEISIVEIINHLINKHPDLIDHIINVNTHLRDKLLPIPNASTILSPLTVDASQAARFFGTNIRTYNKQMLSKLNNAICGASTIFDIGANCGYLSKEFCEIGFNGTLVLFEPIANLLSIAVNTLSSYANVNKIYINTALGENNGKLKLALPDDGNIGWITGVLECASLNNVVEVNQSSTIEYVNTYKPDFIKIDVEGFEKNVLKGLQNIIRK